MLRSKAGDNQAMITMAETISGDHRCQGRTKTASVGRSKSTSEARVVLASCRGSARGISPSLLHGTSEELSRERRVLSWF